MDAAAPAAAIRTAASQLLAQASSNGKCFSIDDFHLCFPMKSRSSAGILGCLLLPVLGCFC